MYYFASDIHLGLNAGTASQDREKLFIKWLDEVSNDAEAIFLVGDVFDFWFEFRKVVPKGFTRLLGKLSELTDRGIKIHFFTGNHDMWTYEYLKEECGLDVHVKPGFFELYGKKVFIAHGDNMYIRKPVMEKIMQSFFHSSTMRWIFKTILHPDLVMKFGQWWSEKSRKSHAKVHVFCGEKEYLVKYAREYQSALKNVYVDYFIFGHIHCAHMYDMGVGQKALFLGEWLYNPSYGIMDTEGNLQLRSYGQDDVVKQ